MKMKFGTVWQADGAFRTTTFVHQKPNLRLMASARGRRSVRYVALWQLGPWKERRKRRRRLATPEATLLYLAILAYFSAFSFPFFFDKK